jgi:hypothetical protein
MIIKPLANFEILSIDAILFVVLLDSIQMLLPRLASLVLDRIDLILSGQRRAWSSIRPPRIVTEGGRARFHGVCEFGRGGKENRAKELDGV